MKKRARGDTSDRINHGLEIRPCPGARSTCLLAETGGPRAGFLYDRADKKPHIARIWRVLDRLEAAAAPPPR